MFAHFQLAIDLSEHRIWVVQAVGIAAAGLVLMVRRFLTAYSRKKPAATPPRPHKPTGPAKNSWRQSETHAYGLPSDLTFKIEETWR